MKKRLKKLVAFISAIVMVVTSLVYVPSTTVKAAELTIDGVTYTVGTISGDNDSFVNNHVGGATISDACFGFAWADNVMGAHTAAVTVKQNDVQVKDLGNKDNGGFVYISELSTLSNGSYTIVYSFATKTVNIELTISGAGGTTTTQAASQTESKSTTQAASESVSEEAELNWQENAYLTAYFGEGTQYAIVTNYEGQDDNKFPGGNFTFAADHINCTTGAHGNSQTLTFNNTVINSSTESYAVGNNVTYDKFVCGENTLRFVGHYTAGGSDLNVDASVIIKVPSQALNFSINDYSSYTGKYVTKFDNASGISNYEVFVDGNATGITVKGSGDYFTVSELKTAGISNGDHTVTLKCVLSEGNYSIASKQSATINVPATAGNFGDIAQIYIQTDDTSLTPTPQEGKRVIDKDGVGKQQAVITVVDKDGGSYSDIFEDATKTTVKVRGNSTAGAVKKAYNITFAKGKDLFGLDGSSSPAKKWSLLANAFDKSLIRNYLGFNIAHQMWSDNATPDYNSNCKFIDLYFNGVYLGNYVLIESVETGEGRVNIPAQDVANHASHVSEALLELEEIHAIGQEAHFTTTLYGQTFIFGSPETVGDYDDNTELFNEKVTAVQNLFNNFETDLKNKNWTKIQADIDIESFVKFYVISEIMTTKDFNQSSTRFYVHNDKIYGGPLWDMDYSSDNNYDMPSYKLEYQRRMDWFDHLMEIPQFKALVVSEYDDINEYIASLYADDGVIDGIIDEISNSATRNYLPKENNGAGWSIDTMDTGDGYGYLKYVADGKAAAGKVAYTSYNGENDPNSAIQQVKDYFKNRKDGLDAIWLNDEEPETTATSNWVPVSFQGSSTIDATGREWKMELNSFHGLGGGNEYYQLANNFDPSVPASVTYGDKANSTISGPILSMTVRGQTGKTLTSLKVGDATLTADTDYYYTTTDDVIYIKQSAFSLGRNTLTFDFNGSEYNVLFEVSNVETTTAAPTTTAAEKWSTIGSGYDGRLWKINNTAHQAINQNAYRQLVKEGSQATYGDKGNADINTNFIAIAFTSEITANITSVKIGDTTLVRGTDYCTNTENNDVIYIKQDSFPEGMTTLTVSSGGNTYSIGFDVEDAIDVIDPLDDEDVPDNLEWIDFGGADSHNWQFCYPSAYAEFKQVGDNCTNNQLYLPQKSVGAPYKTVTINGNDYTNSGAAFVSIQQNVLVENGVYRVDVTDANNNSFVIYIKKDKAADYKPTGLAASVSNDIANISWEPSSDAIAAAATFTVKIDDTVILSDSTMHSATYDISSMSKGTHTVTLTTYVDGLEVDTQTTTLNYSDYVINSFKATGDTKLAWEKYRADKLDWNITSASPIVGYAYYVDDKLYETEATTETTHTYMLPAYAIAQIYSQNDPTNGIDAFGQAKSSGSHTVKVVSFTSDLNNAPATYTSDLDGKVVGIDSFEQDVSYIFGNQSLWNKTSASSPWNFTITDGSKMKINYRSDGSVKVSDMKVNKDADEPQWQLKAAIYDRHLPVAEDGNKVNVKFDVRIGDEEFVGKQLYIKICSDEVDDNYSYYGEETPATSDVTYDQEYYTFESDGRGGSVIHYSITFEPHVDAPHGDQYDLLFGIGELEGADLELTVPEVTDVYKVTKAIASANLTDAPTLPGTITINWNSDVPEDLKEDYYYVTKIDGKIVSDDAQLSETHTGYEADSTHTVTVESWYKITGTMTGSAETEVTIPNVQRPNIVAASINIDNSSSRYVGDTIPIKVIVANVGDAACTDDFVVKLEAQPYGKQAVAVGTAQTITVDLPKPADPTNPLADAVELTFNYPITDAGNTTFIATVDVNDSVTESTETDNVTMIRYMFYDKPANNEYCDVVGFQLNALTAEESNPSYYGPSFRTMARISYDDKNNHTIGGETVTEYGMVFALTDKAQSVDKDNMRIDSDDEYVAHLAANTKIDYSGWTTRGGKFTLDNSSFYGLTIKNLFYDEKELTKNYSFRAYYKLGEEVVYSNNIYTVNMEEIANDLYQNQKMYSKKSHEFLYNAILNPVAAKKNYLNIGRTMINMFRKKDSSITQNSPEYIYTNMVYKDIQGYGLCKQGYCYGNEDEEKVPNKDLRFTHLGPLNANNDGDNTNDMHLFESRRLVEHKEGDKTGVYLGMLNDLTHTNYSSIYDWIYNEIPENGFARRHAYSWEGHQYNSDDAIEDID